jgi:DNA-binding CsgD family transcriptional regulator
MGFCAKRPMACITNLLTISPAERRVLALLLEGSSNRLIAARLGLSPRTVESHIGAMFEKTGCRNRSQLLLWGQMNGRRIGGSMETTSGMAPS